MSDFLKVFLLGAAITITNSINVISDDRFGYATGEQHVEPRWLSLTPYTVAAASGAAWLRNDIPWSSIENASGAYGLSAEKRTWLDQALAAGLRVCVCVLAGGIYTPTNYTDQYDVTGYAKACAWLATSHPAIGAIEVLNEPNNNIKSYKGALWREALVKLTGATTKAVHAVNPAMTVIGLGAQGGDILYMLSLNPQVDGVVVHPYDNGNRVPEVCYEPPYSDYEKWMAALKAATTLPIWETEYNISTGGTLYAESCWLSRRIFLSLGNGVAHTFPFEFIDYSGFTDQGIVDYKNLKPRPAYYALQRFFGPGPIFGGVTRPVMQGLTVASTKPTVTDTDPAFDFKNLKNYLFADSGENTVAVLWFGNKAPGYDGAPRRSTATVSFPRTLSYDLANSYVLETVTGKTIPLQNFQASRVNDVFTISGLPISQEPVAIVLQTGR